MFSHISGRVISFTETGILVEANGLGYEIFLAPCIAEPLRAQAPEHITLHIYPVFTLEGNSGRFTFFGFHNTIEREFFESLTSVASIGPKSAARAFSKPMARIARAIDEGDTTFLMSLPGIGRQKAREIVAKLQGKVARFMLIVEEDTPTPARTVPDFAKEAIDVLLQLGYRLAEAETLVDETRAEDTSIADAERLLAEIYRRRTPALGRL